MKLLALVIIFTQVAFADSTPAEKGFHYLTEEAITSAFGPFNISKEEFDKLYLTWPEDERLMVEQNPSQRRALIMKKYGFTPKRLPVENADLPFGFTDRKKNGKYEMSCLTCHSGSIKYAEEDGQLVTKTLPGISNTELDLQSFFEDRLKLRELDKKWGARGFKGFAFRQYMKSFLRDDKITYARGTTVPWKNVSYILWMRTKRMNLKVSSFLRALISIKSIDDYGTTPVSVDVPAWWTTAEKSHLYADAFAPFAGKSILVSALTFGSPTKKLLGEFNNIEAYIRQMKAPANPFAAKANREQVKKGEKIFNLHCAECHGEYKNGVLDQRFKTRVVDINSIGTDPARLMEGVTREFRDVISRTWAGNYGDNNIRINPVGYQAPPLTGLWATAPYFHNGSVPTVYHVLFPYERPVVWRADDKTIDEKNLGFKFESFEEVPLVLSEHERRKFYDTNLYSLGSEGHLYPEKLSRQERLMILEYLKTL